MTILSFYCLTITAQGQKFHRFCEEGKVWLNDYFQVISNTWYHNITKLDGDTVIAGKECLKAYVNDTYRGAFFDEGYRTFYILPEHTEPKLVYDFSLQIGDQIVATILHTNTEENLVVTDVKEVQYGENTLKSITVKNGKAQYEWIEGVGHKYGPLPGWYYVFPGSARSSDKQIGLCSVKGSFLYWKDELSGGTANFTAENKHWLVSNSLTDETEIYLMQGDTIIAGQKAKRMFYDGEYIGAFFDEGSKTFFIPQNEENAYLYYNFADPYEGLCKTVWHKGKYAHLFIKKLSDWWTSQHNFMYIEGEDLSTKDSFQENIQKASGKWYRGIGSLSGPMNNWNYPLEEQSQTLLACWTPDELIYDPMNITNITSPPTYGSSSSKVFNLMGIKANQQGIVIENGRKVLR